MDAHVETPRTRLAYEGWSDALGQRFFRAEYHGLHVMFFVDETCLAELSGLEDEQAVDSLRQAVWPKLTRHKPRAVFDRIARDTRDWKRKGADGFPPSLPLLALCVLAATRMSRTKDRAGHNYYVPFIELLEVDLSEDEVIESYGVDVPWLWRNLRWWLDEHHRGALGFSTIEEHRHWTRIGWADSQTLFTSSDRDKLTQFFEWMGYRPGDDIDERELLLHFRRWSLGRDDLSAGTAVMLEDDVYPQQLAELLLQAAKRWEGIVRDEGGSFVAEIAVTFQVAPRPRVGVAAPRPRGFPETLTVTTPFGTDIPLAVDELGLGEERQWYEGLDFEITTSMLEGGLILRSGHFVLRLPPYHLHILHKSPELGCWASHSTLRPEEPAWLLVRRRILDRVLAYLATAGAGEAMVVERVGVAPKGWRLIRDVFLPVDAPAPPEGLGRLKPRVSNRMGLVGGLSIVAGRVYLTGGEPDLQLPGDEAAEGVTVELDGEPRTVPDGLLRLRGQLQAGAHEVRLEGVPRHFLVHETLGRLRPVVEVPISHLAAGTGTACRAVTFGAKLKDGGKAPVRVMGAAIERDASETLKPPIVLPAAASEVTLVGPLPGEILRVTPPAAPRWITDLKNEHRGLHLGYRVFEYHPSFEVVWIACSYRLGPVVRLASELPPGNVPQGDLPGVDEWCSFFLNREDYTGSEPLWEAYHNVAEGLAL